MKLHILKVTDSNDHLSDPMYYTIKFLRERVVSDFYDNWGECEITKEQIIESDKKVYEYMSYFGFDIETILTITENDIPKRSNVIEVDVAFYHPDDENGNVDETKKVYDEEGMLQEFEYKLKQIIKS